METLVGVFRCNLPVRYWRDSHRGALFAILITAAIGARLGYAGFFQHASTSGEQAARLALRVAQPDQRIEGVDQKTAVRTALQSNVLAPFEFFLFTRMGWLSLYLFVSATYRAFALATDHPRGDPILTGIDNVIHDFVDRGSSLVNEVARLDTSGIWTSDVVHACRRFNGNDADFVVVSILPKKDWLRGTTLLARRTRLRVGQAHGVMVEGQPRTCYPLTVTHDAQVDRRVVPYKWPRDAPPLPEPEYEPDPA
ncbi:MAG: hypothetical protein ABI672_17440 [Vicinamibacteria bacterium]